MILTFLFGSGADTDANENLKSGQGFAKILLENHYSEWIKTTTEIEASNYKLLYPKSKKIYLQTIYENLEEARKVFDENVIRDVKTYYESQVDDECKKRIDEYCANWYKILIKNQSYKKDDEKVFFLQKAVFFDSLDEKFNSLRYVRKNNINANRVKAAYYNIFCEILHELFNEDFDKINSFDEVFNLLNKDYQKNISDKSYYKIVSNIPKKNNVIHVTTTNYTNLVKNTEIEDIVFLHGNLNWFENLQKLTVLDCTNKMDLYELKGLVNCKKISSDIIPFILIPSGVKPLICKKEIEQFHQFVNDLKESNYLIIVGYKFNSEDNHINSIIADWLRENPKNRIIYFNYSDSTEFIDLSNLFWIGKNFNIQEIENYSERINVKEFENEKQIINIRVNRDNSNQIFQDVINQLIGEK